MKLIAAICPLCQAQILLGPEGEPRGTEEDKAAVLAHIESHTLAEWAQGMQALRNEFENQVQLRNMPRCAMPRA